MANSTTSPNMDLVLPVPSVDPGPEWANLVYNSLNTNVDQHDHSSGKGVQITPNGLNINADLPFNANNATMLRTARFANQSAIPSGASDLGCIFVYQGDLYYIDESGNVVRFTQSGAIYGTIATAAYFYSASIAASGTAALASPAGQPIISINGMANITGIGYYPIPTLAYNQTAPSNSVYLQGSGSVNQLYLHNTTAVSASVNVLVTYQT